MGSEWDDNILGIKKEGFERMALELFQFQYDNNGVYKAFVNALHVKPWTVSRQTQIPFLPISFFKTHEVITRDFEPQAIFKSSGTTQSVYSSHMVKDLALYEKSFRNSFEAFYGKTNEWCILGLLPSYLERADSSLVYMVDQLIKDSAHPFSGFYLNEHEKLVSVLKEQEARSQKTLLIGVSFALLDLAEAFPIELKHTTVMETGGMKGRREEITREELHSILKNAFKVQQVHSEYGMTELLSQAYSKGEGVFQTPPWMKILIRDEEDPLNVKTDGRGVINVIDLANIHSCCFIATDDAGKLNSDGSFEVLGRVDASDVRGCSLMVE